jgi:preprotein translocase subunit SecG
MLIGAFSQYFFGISIFLSSIFLILLVLVQRGRGGGLTGALGGPGGQSAFGTKAGDLFTRITIGVAAAWIFLCAASVFFLREGGIPEMSGDAAVSQASGSLGGDVAAESAAADAGADLSADSAESSATPEQAGKASAELDDETVPGESDTSAGAEAPTAETSEPAEASSASSPGDDRNQGN